ncbi:MAG: transglutaminase TgpA family protein [Acidimicrobiales bacterium]
MREDNQPPIWLEVAAALLVPAACVGFSRVFIEASTVLPIIGASLLSSAVAVLARRLRVPLLLSTVISLALLGALIINRYAPGTARLGIIPTGETVDQLRLLFDELIRNFQELKTPVPALQPFVAASMIGAWIMAFLTDWGAMRLRLAFEPVLPSGLLFIFTSIPPVSAGGNQVISTIVFGAAVAAWAVSQRSANLLQRGVWLANDHRRGPASIGTTGAVVAAVAVLAGAIIGGRLPGAGADPVYSFKDQGDPTRVVVSPFVNIRSRLVSQTSQELFTVASDKPTYWRIAGLDTYEDDIWKVAGDFSPETGRLPGQREYDGDVTEVSQDYSISALAAIWLPAAFAPSEVVAATAEVTWNAENSSLTVANNVENSDGVQYALKSNVPAFSVEQLQSSSEAIPGDIAQRYLKLPPDLTPQVLQQAAALTDGLTSRYDKMRALQDHFRSYTYNVRLGVREGDPIEQFLREREGFCQQFAGTFALMARSLGIPARVATGFTWGDPIGNDDATGKTIYKVTGRHTHAWPEVYFDDFGWVAFEPTPGRGLPGAVSYTGVAATQDSDVQPNNPGEPTTTTTTDPSAATGDTAEPNFELFDEGTLIEPVEEPGALGFNVPWRLLGLLAVIGIYVGGLPLLWQLRRRARRNRADTPAKRVETAWAEAVESLELGFDLRRSPAETRSEYAGRLQSDRRVASDELTELADVATVARFHPGGVSELRADQADQLAGRIETSMKNRVPIYARLRRQLDPRRLIKPSVRVVTETQSPILQGSANEVKEPVGAGRS